MFLEGITVSELDICCMQTRHMVSFGRHLGDGNMAFENSTGRRKRMEEQMEGEGVYHSALDGGLKNQLERHHSKNSRNTKLCEFS